MRVLPKGFHRLRQYWLFASTNRARATRLPAHPSSMSLRPQPADSSTTARCLPLTLRACALPMTVCGARMIVIEPFAPRLRADTVGPTPNRIDTYETHTPCKRCCCRFPYHAFPAPAATRSTHRAIHQCADRRVDAPPNTPPDASYTPADLPYPADHTSNPRASTTPTIEPPAHSINFIALAA